MLYQIENDELIEAVAAYYNFKGDTSWWKVSRQHLNITDEWSGSVYPIPKEIRG